MQGQSRPGRYGGRDTREMVDSRHSDDPAPGAVQTLLYYAVAGRGGGCEASCNRDLHRCMFVHRASPR